MVVIVGISTAIGCAITLIYAAEDLHQKTRTKGKTLRQLGQSLHKEFQILNTTK